jgi:hypothetical protein
MRPLRSALACALAITLPLAAAHAGDHDDLDKLNGDVRVEAGGHVGKASSVNGDVRVGEGASVTGASTVNGEIELAAHAQAGEVGTVNGGIELGPDSHVRGEVKATNGAIRLERGAQVGGRLSNVNGEIELDHAQVGAGIATVAGDITVGAGSKVEGGILVDENHGWFSSHDSRVPHVTIGPGAVVHGTLEFRREVVLRVSDRAQIGPVKGAAVQRFSGDAP